MLRVIRQVRQWFRTRIARWCERRTIQRALGPRGEAAAARFLAAKGFRIVDRGVRGLLGEIDLVAVERRTIVFVEVKTRRSNRRGDPADAVDADKQRRLTRLALVWLRRHELLEHAARFDVVAVTWPDDAAPPEIRHYENAFPAVGRGQFFS